MTPIDRLSVQKEMDALGISNITTASIRQICSLVASLEAKTGQPFVHLEIGNPGLPAAPAGVAAECQALQNGVASCYPDIAGIPALKNAASHFIKAFLNTDIPPRCIIPTVGSMQGSFTLFLTLAWSFRERNCILFLDPGFPAQHTQAQLLGIERRSIDIYGCRGEALRARLDEAMADGRVMGIMYNNPNNPAWFNLTDEEMQIIADAAERYDSLIIEDHAYMGMDFRTDYSHPGQAPYVPTIARYTDRFILLLSASKIFSYAGQRIATVAMSPRIFDFRCPEIMQALGIESLGNAYIYRILYCASSGVSHSAQHALAAMFSDAAEGKLDFVALAREYGRRGAEAKRAFTDNGFHIVYDRDGDKPISDGFFFTVSYPGMTSAQLQSELIRYGISAISLPSTGSRQHGLRVCVSMLNAEHHFQMLRQRLQLFNQDHSHA